MTLRLENVLASEELPSLPEVAHRILRLAEQESTDVDTLTNAVKADPAMAAKILKTANSAFFGRQYKVTSLQAAIPVLGATLIRTLVLGFSLSRQQSWRQLEDVYRKVWRRALTQAVAAELLGRKSGSSDPDSFFVAGLIQDVGVLAILSTGASDYVEQVFRHSTIVDLASNERRYMGFSHVDVGVRLCENWQLAPLTIEAIRDHHGPVRWLKQAPPVSALAQTLKLATRIAHHLETPSNEISRDLTTSLSKCCGISKQGIPEFLDEIDARIAEASNAFSMDIDELLAPHELLGKARTAMEGIAIQSQLDAAAAKKDAMHVRDRLASAEDRSRYFEQEMFKDPLTGAHNRRLLETGLETEIAVCREGQKPLGMLFLDIDKFKTLNDVCGHKTGDRALRSVVGVLQGSLRDDDLVIRYGGDEFIAILIGVSVDTLREVAQRICCEVQRALNELTDEVHASASLGGIHCPCDQLSDVSVDSLINEVDRRMYQAKQQGGGQCAVVSVQDTTAFQTVND